MSSTQHVQEMLDMLQPQSDCVCSRLPAPPTARLWHKYNANVCRGRGQMSAEVGVATTHKVELLCHLCCRQRVALDPAPLM